MNPLRKLFEEEIKSSKSPSGLELNKIAFLKMANDDILQRIFDEIMAFPHSDYRLWLWTEDHEWLQNHYVIQWGQVRKLYSSQNICWIETKSFIRNCKLTKLLQ